MSYPGDDYVDILGFDDYEDFKYDKKRTNEARKRIRIVGALANEKKKPCALTEVGYFIKKDNPQKGIIRIPDDADIYAHSTKKQYSTADIDAVKEILKLSVETLPENSINAPR